MDPLSRKLVQAALRASTNRIDTAKDLVAHLVKDGIFGQGDIDSHMEEIIAIWKEWKQDAAPSPPDSSVGGKGDDADSNGPTGGLTGRLALYGPVDDKVKSNNISLHRPQSGSFGYATLRQSQGSVSFIQAKAVKANKLVPDDDGTIVIQWKPFSCADDDFDDRGDETARHTCCVVLSVDEAKEVGMKVDVVLGVHCLEDLDEQRSCIPLPRCPTPPQAPTSETNQLDDPPSTSSLDDVHVAAPQTILPLPQGSYRPTWPSQPGPSAGIVYNFFFNTPSDPMALAGQIIGQIGDRGATPSAATPAPSILEAQTVGGASKRKAGDDAPGFGRSKKLQC